MNNALMAIGALLIAALAALFAVPYFIDWNGYRGVFEEEASRVLGRDVRVGGKVNLRLLPSPYVRFDRVRIADTSGLTGEPIFRAETFTMWLSVPPLLKGVLEARQVELKRPVLTVAVDGQGRGSWNGLKLTTGALPFVPANVTLQSMRISDGAVTVQRAGGEALAEVTSIEGEVESDALQGPYRFKGSAKWRGEAREIRLATAAPDADGSVRFKTIVRVPQSANAYTLEGQVGALMSRPHLEGDLSAKIGLDLRGEPDQGQGQPVGKAKKAEDLPRLDLKLHVRADGTGAKLTDIAGSLENVGQPQIVTGSGELEWVRGTRIAASLSSRWLDLDRLTRAGSEGAPLETVLGLADEVMHVLPAEAASTVTMTVDQVNLGGDAVAGLVVSASHAEGPLKLDTLRASLPGGAKLELSGTITGGKDRKLSGTLDLHGPSFGRFVNWAAREPALIASRHDGPFAVHGGLGFSRAGVELTGASADIAGSNVTGEVRYRTGERDRLELVLAGGQVDAGALWSVARRNGALAALEEAVAEKRDEAAGADVKPGKTDLAMKIRAGELTAGEATWRDVEADITVHDGTIDIARLKGATSDGAGLSLEGEIARGGKQPSGRLKWAVEASGARSLATLARQGGPRLAALADGLAAPESLFPLKLAGSLDLGQPSPAALGVAFDGQSGPAGGRITGRAVVEGGAEAWRSSPVDLMLTADAVDDDAAAFLLGGGRDRAPHAANGAPKGQLVVKASGIPDKGMAALASLSSDSLSLAYDGRVTLAAGAVRRLDGHASVTARDLRPVLALAGLSIGDAAGKVAVRGGVDVASADDALTLAARGLTVAGMPVEGTVRLTSAAGRPLQIAADVASGAVSLQGLTRAVLDDRKPAGGADDAPAAVWPELAFDLAPLDRIEGAIHARFSALSVAPGMVLSDADLAVQLKPGKLAITDLSGSGLGGRTRARFDIERQPAGVRLAGEVALEDLDLARLGAKGDRHRASGTAGLKLSLEGRALSPAALVAGLGGKGRLVLDRDVSIAGFGAQPVAAAAETVVAGKVDVQGEALLAVLSEALAAGRLKLGPRTIELEVAGGAIRVPPISVESAAGRTTLVSTIELGSAKVDSEIRVEAKVARKRLDGSEPTSLPPLTVGYVGDIGALRTLEPRISIGGLERELVVRRMERSVEELERLRREDEERARKEKERQRQAEEKARAEAEAAARAAAQQQQQGWGPQNGAAPQAPAAPERPWLTSPPVPATGEGAAAEPDAQGAGPTVAAQNPEPSGGQPEASAAARQAQPQAERKAYNRADPPRSQPVRKLTPTDLMLRQLRGTPN